MAKEKSAEDLSAEKELLALLKKEQEIHTAASVDAEEGKVLYYRRKRAQEFVTGYKTVLQLKTELIAAGLDPELFTAKLAEDSLVEQWSTKAENKASEAI